MEPNMYKQTGTCALPYRTVTASTMSSSTPGQSSAPSSDFKSILDAALRKYEERTEKPLFDDPLADALQRCDSVDTLKAIFQSQADALRAKGGDERFMKWIGPTVDVLCTFSDTLGAVAGIVRCWI